MNDQVSELISVQTEYMIRIQ